MQNVKDFLGHYLTYAVAVATIVAKVSPLLIPPQYSWVIPVAGAVVAMGHHSYKQGAATAILEAAGKAALTAANSAVVKMLPLFVTALLVTGLLGSVSGCAQLQSFVQDNQALASVAVEVATGKVIEVGKTDAERKARADQVKTIALSAQAMLSGDKVTLAVIHDAVQARLATLNLQPSDRLLANAVVNAVDLEIKKRVGDGLLSADQRVSVDEIFGWVVEATAAYTS